MTLTTARRVLLAEAQRRRGDTELTFVQGDYRKLPFEDASFDLVLNLFTRDRLLGRRGRLQAFREFRRVLRPGGRAVIETMHRDRLARDLPPTRLARCSAAATCCSRSASSTRSRALVNVTFSYRPHAAEPRTVRYSIRDLHRHRGRPDAARAPGSSTVETYGGYDGSPFTLDSRLVAVAS